MRWRFAPLLTAVAAAVLVGSPVAASAPDHVRTDADLGVLSICGLDLDVHLWADDHYFASNGHYGDRFVSRASMTLTSVTTGRVVVQDVAGIAADGTPVAGPNGTTIVTFSLSGLAIRLVGDTGAVLATDAGRFSVTTTFDAAGSVIDESFDIAGPHDSPVCDLLEAALS